MRTVHNRQRRPPTSEAAGGAAGFIVQERRHANVVQICGQTGSEQQALLHQRCLIGPTLANLSQLSSSSKPCETRLELELKKDAPSRARAQLASCIALLNARDAVQATCLGRFTEMPAEGNLMSCTQFSKAHAQHPHTNTRRREKSSFMRTGKSRKAKKESLIECEQKTAPYWPTG